MIDRKLGPHRTSTTKILKNLHRSSTTKIFKNSHRTSTEKNAPIRTDWCALQAVRGSLFRTVRLTQLFASNPKLEEVIRLNLKLKMISFSLSLNFLWLIRYFATLTSIKNKSYWFLFGNQNRKPWKIHLIWIMLPYFLLCEMCRN